MPYCLNPECSHRKKTGKPAEFLEGHTHCSDCGSELSDDLPEEHIFREKESIPQGVSPDFYKRILITLGAVALWRLMVHFPLPGIDFESLQGFIPEWGEYSFIDNLMTSVLALGLMPYISAYVLVEVLALVVPKFKSWREGGYQGRLKLNRTARIVTLVIALLQGYGIATGLESMAMAVINPGYGFRIITMLTLTTGTFIGVFLADLITRTGIGHGVSIILFSGFASPGVWIVIQHIKSALDSDPVLLVVNLLLCIFAIGVAVSVVVVMEKSHKKISVRFSDGLEAHMPIKLTTGGIEPARWASGFIMLPATIAGFSGTPAIQNLAHNLTPGTLGYSVFSLIVLVFLYYVFTSFFYQPKKMRAFLKERNADFIIPSQNKDKYLDRVIEIMALIGVIYLFVFTSMPDVFRNPDINLGIFSLSLLVAVVIIMDVTGEVRFRRTGSLIKVCELHDVPMAGLFKSILEQKGIPCHLRGYYHRALLYFFGPYIEISALVPEERADEAKVVIERYWEMND